MIFIKQRIAPMQEGIERMLFTFVLKQVKKARGLTKRLDHEAGINAKWTNVNQAFNISAETFMKIIFNKALFQTRSEFEKDVKDFVEHLYEDIIPQYHQDNAKTPKNKNRKNE